MFIPDPLGNLGKIITKGMGKLKALSKPLREKIGGTFGKSNKPNRGGTKAELDLDKHKLNKAQLQKLNDDLANNPALKDAMDGKPELVDAWKKLDDAGVDDVIRKSPNAVKKTKRYTDNGYKIEKDGVVKQADGTEVGKLEMGDAYNPGELKVKGKHSGRQFDPDDAGGPIKKLDWKNANIQSSGISDVEKHLSRFGDSPANTFMIDRLKKIQKGDIPATDFDKRFYTHELTEYQRYKNLGVPDGQNPAGVWDNAHTASLEDYRIHERKQPIYHPDAPE